MKETITLPAEWAGWQIEELIGSGSYGDVYRASAADPLSGTEQKAAIKIIRIPANESEERAIAYEYPDIEDRTRYCENVVQSLLSEINAMKLLKDNRNTVQLQDSYVQHAPDSLSWTVFIRMELLTSLTDYLVSHPVDEQMILNLGIGICGALVECERKNILHRDIKPENIMVASDGTFKLGDFGVARQLEATSRSMSIKGTFTYMAPEVYHGERYDSLADQYSLGIVLYRLLNRNRDPFLDPDTRIVYYKDREEALQKRMKGDPLPAPADATEDTAAVILKTCAFEKAQRYKSISDLKNDLMVCAGQMSGGKLICRQTAGGAGSKTSKKPVFMIAGIAAIIAAVVIILLATGIFSGKKSNSTDKASGEDSAGDTAESVSSSGESDGGTFGDNMTWKLEDDVLTISGTGAMPDYNLLNDPAPWDHMNFEKIVVEEGITTISDYAFHAYFGRTKYISLPDSLLSISSSAISAYDLVSLNIPKNVNYIGEGSFKNCYSLTSITVDDQNKTFDSRDNCNAIIETATNTMVAACNYTVIPDSVTAIGPYAFPSNDDLKRIVIPDNVTSIDDEAFNDTTELTICGSAGSAAEKFAKEHGFEFVEN